MRIPLQFIDRLEHEAVESFRSLSSRGSEIGGILLGSFVPGSPGVVTVDDYELITCDYSRGPLYRLSDADMGRFDRALEQRGAKIVGFFRSHTRKGLSLDAEDLSFFQSRFREPHQIALLVRPFASKASTAGIFIWESGQVHGEASAQEFPFRASQLKAAGGEQPVTAIESAPAAAVAAPVVPKTPARAQIVPIASRREIALPGPAVIPAETPAAAVEPDDEEPPAIQAAPEPERRLELKPSPKPAPEPPASDVEAPVVAAPRGGKFVKLTAAAALAVAAFVALFVYPGFIHRFNRPATVPSQEASALSLRVEHSGSELLLTWNRDSAAIKSASKAVLEISDGAQHENVQMDLAQLRNGSIVYSPSTADVSFRMEVTGADQSKTASESVRVLRTRPSPLDQPDAAAGTPPAQTPPANVAANGSKPAASNPKAEAEDTKSPAASEPPPAEESRPARAGAPVKPFSADSLSVRLRPTRPTDMPDAPTVAGNISAPSTVTGLNLNGITAAPLPPLPPPRPASVQTAPPERKAPSGGQIKQAVLLYRKEPDYPRLAKQAGAKGEVEIVATIGLDGKLKNVKAVRGHPMLVKAATDAVAQWVYKPTQLNGQPVETQTQILLNFVGDR
ncbi:MAG TPA: TonB family protein [Bryobacteraceae bacterium]